MSGPEATMRALLDELQRVVEGVCTHAELERVNALLAPEIRRLAGRLCAAVDIGADLSVDDPAAESGPIQRLERFAAGRASPEETDVLRQQVSAFLFWEGAVSLERCLHAPRSTAGWRNARRDYWLRRAGRLVAAEHPGASVADTLHAMWSKFLAPGGKWSRWKGDGKPPPDATQLSVALFYASRWHRASVKGALTSRELRDVLTSRQLRRVLSDMLLD